MTEPIISFNDFSFKYNSQVEPSLQHLNLQIQPGQKVLIVGPSGSGKSTLAKCINGLIPNVDAGEITGSATVAGHPVGKTELFELSFSVSTVLQDPDSQFTGLTAAEDIAFALENDEVPQTKMHKIVAEWAEKLNITDILSNAPQALSGGQKQKVSLAGVLVNNAPILLLDEPLANLDPQSSLAILALVNRLQAELGFTVIIIEHRLGEVLSQTVDQVVVFNEGQIVSDLAVTPLLRSDILEQNGIEPPLYIDVLKAAGVDLQQYEQLDNLSDLALTETDQQKVRAWVEAGKTTPVHLSDKPLLTVKNVSFRYNANHSNPLQYVSFTINEGDFVSVVGQNGAGKSTMMKLICGFLRGTGTIDWKGHDLADESIKEIAEKIGFVMQDPNKMISQKTVFAEVALGLRLRNYEKVDEKVAQVLKVCGLYPFRNWPISALSYGQRKRVTIASILVLNPKLLILDEPTAGQDWETYTAIMSFLDELHQQGITIAIITHDMQLMTEYTDRSLVFGNGKLLADTTPFGILANDDLIKAANLAKTSLAELAEKVGVSDERLVKRFMQRKHVKKEGNK
ncbi:ABC transporter ATP-binding protein [Fructilactobacillus frigidiflavus]|uniref:ABC transporter ATP-binding protein n=1 Tax=Fructilactobacillus frigidiflavus TaxID=3242688 RepID=UPI0037569DDA